MFVEGLGRDRIARFTRRDVRIFATHDIRGREERTHFDAQRWVNEQRAKGRPSGDVGPSGRPGDRRVESARPGARFNQRPKAQRAELGRPLNDQQRAAPAAAGRFAPANQRQAAGIAKPVFFGKANSSANPSAKSIGQKRANPSH